MVPITISPNISYEVLKLVTKLVFCEIIIHFLSITTKVKGEPQITQYRDPLSPCIHYYIVTVSSKL